MRARVSRFIAGNPAPVSMHHSRAGPRPRDARSSPDARKADARERALHRAPVPVGHAAGAPERALSLAHRHREPRKPALPRHVGAANAGGHFAVDARRDLAAHAYDDALRHVEPSPVKPSAVEREIALNGGRLFAKEPPQFAISVSNTGTDREFARPSGSAEMNGWARPASDSILAQAEERPRTSLIFFALARSRTEVIAPLSWSRSA